MASSIINPPGNSLSLDIVGQFEACPANAGYPHAGHLEAVFSASLILWIYTYAGMTAALLFPFQLLLLVCGLEIVAADSALAGLGLNLFAGVGLFTHWRYINKSKTVHPEPFQRIYEIMA